jgi:biopolymer transport protein ExbD
MQFPRKPRRRPTLNIIPLIDILVVLLIFYIATTVFKTNAPKIDIKPPKSTTATVTQETPPSIIYITSDSKFFLDDTPIDPEGLADLLKSKLAANPAFKVAMKADTNAPFGAITKVLDAAHLAGITDLPTFMNSSAKAGDASP